MSTTTREQPEVKTLGDHYESSLAAKFGEELAQGNKSCIPHTIIYNFAKAGLTNNELAFWIVVQSYQFNQKLPHPGVDLIADSMQKSRRTVERYIRRLCEKGFLIVTREEPNAAGYSVNHYDFRPFYERVLMVALHLEVPPIPRPERKPKPVESPTEPAVPAPQEPPATPATAPECVECEEPAAPPPSPEPKSPPSPRLPETLDRRIAQLSNEFNDAPSTKSNKTRIADLLDEWVSAGLDEEHFSAVVEELATLTRQAKRVTARSKTNGKPTRMPYFFKLLKDACAPEIEQGRAVAERNAAEQRYFEQQKEAVLRRRANTPAWLKNPEER